MQHSWYRLNWQCFYSLNSLLFTQASIKGQVLTWRIHPSAFPFSRTRRMPIIGPLLQPEFPDLLFKLDTWFAEVYGTPAISWGLVGSRWMSGWFLTMCQCGQVLINWFPKTEVELEGYQMVWVMIEQTVCVKSVMTNTFKHRYSYVFAHGVMVRVSYISDTDLSFRGPTSWRKISAFGPNSLPLFSLISREKYDIL